MSKPGLRGVLERYDAFPEPPQVSWHEAREWLMKAAAAERCTATDAHHPGRCEHVNGHDGPHKIGGLEWFDGALKADAALNAPPAQYADLVARLHRLALVYKHQGMWRVLTEAADAIESLTKGGGK